MKDYENIYLEATKIGDYLTQKFIENIKSILHESVKEAKGIYDKLREHIIGICHEIESNYEVKNIEFNSDTVSVVFNNSHFELDSLSDIKKIDVFIPTDIFENIDYFLDSNQEGNPKIVTGNALRSALKKTTQRPFRLVPYFDLGVWGGQWMKKNCDLDEKQNNYAWSFDGVPEENSLYFRFGDTRIEIPAMD